MNKKSTLIENLSPKDKRVFKKMYIPLSIYFNLTFL